MTPLAQRILRRCIGDKKDRYSEVWKGAGSAIDELRGAHFFDFTAIDALVGNLLDTSSTQNIEAMLQNSFLPAEKTWLEGEMGGHRVGYLVKQYDNQQCADIYMFADYGFFPIATIGLMGNSSQFVIPPASVLGDYDLPVGSYDEYRELAGTVALNVATILAMINTPRIIGRKQHMPRRGLEKRLLSRRKAIGRFPLNGWTEIKLEVTPNPKDLSDGEPQEAHLTGERALHYCRAHLRLKAGKIEYVRGHWRGDASLGIKRSRYILKDSAA